MEGQATVGRFSVEFVVANYRDVDRPRLVLRFPKE